jgi:nitrite reductase (NADH) small subunit
MTATRLDSFTPETVWSDVCAYDDLEPGRGVCALVGSHQVALFRAPVGDALYAISNFDPFSQAYVLSRGIVGSCGDVLKVSSPVFKQSFDLRTGECLDDPAVRVATYAVCVVRGRVQVAHA